MRMEWNWLRQKSKQNLSTLVTCLRTPSHFEAAFFILATRVKGGLPPSEIQSVTISQIDQIGRTSGNGMTQDSKLIKF